MVARSPERRLLEVPFFDLRPSLREEKAAILADLAAVVDEGAFTNGPQVAEFEHAFADYCGAPFAVGTANGLDALRLALLALGVEPGDEVVVPAMTFIATLEAMTQAGARPVVADVSDEDYCLDPEAAAAAITPRTRHLLPVHLYGQMADLARLQPLAERRGVGLLEDACQAHGASRDGRRAGTVGLAAAFSFYPAKNLGAFGDAGAAVTGDEALAAAVRSLREHGQYEKYRHAREGWTSRLDTVQAVVLLRRLPLLEGWNEDRRRAVASYVEALDGVGDLRLPPVPEGSVHAWHLFVVRTAAPERLAHFLRGRGIGTGRHYPEPPHLSPAYAWLGHRPGEFPVAERLAAECLSLPLFPGISEPQLEAVADAVRAYFE